MSASGKVTNWAFENSTSQNSENCHISDTEDQGSEAVPAPDENDKTDSVAMSSARGAPIDRSLRMELR